MVQGSKTSDTNWAFNSISIMKIIEEVFKEREIMSLESKIPLVKRIVGVVNDLKRIQIYDMQMISTKL